MNVINKIPGPLLDFYGSFKFKFWGLIVKSFEGSTLVANSYFGDLYFFHLQFYLFNNYL